MEDNFFTPLEYAAYALAEEQWSDEGEASAEFALKQLGMEKGCLTAACAMRTLQEREYQKRIDLLMKDKGLPLYKYAPLSDSKLVPSPDGTWVKVEELKLKLSSDAVLRLEQVAPVDVMKKERVHVSKQQDDAILEWLKANSYDPLNLPVGENGMPGVRSKCKVDMRKSAELFQSDKVFITAWDRLRADKKTKAAE